MQEVLKIQNDRGLSLAAILELPEENADVYPFVILLHGFKGYKEEENYSTLATELLEQGIGSIRFDASGFGESEGTLADDYRFSNYYRDVEAVYRWLLSRPFVDANHLGVCGASMGGAQAINFAAKHPEIQAVCAISCPDKIGTRDALGGNVAKQWKASGFLEEVSSKYGPILIPYAYLQDAQQFSCIDLVRKIKVPILIILGKEDDVVLPEQTQAVFQAANQPKQLVELAKMDHAYKKNPEVLDMVNGLVTEFFLERL